MSGFSRDRLGFRRAQAATGKMQVGHCDVLGLPS